MLALSGPRTTTTLDLWHCVLEFPGRERCTDQDLGKPLASTSLKTNCLKGTYTVGDFRPVTVTPVPLFA